MKPKNEQNCTQCGLTFRSYWLKDGVCNGCRNPHLIVKAQVRGQHPETPCDNLDCPECCEHNEHEAFICLDCGAELDPGEFADDAEYLFGEDR